MSVGPVPVRDGLLAIQFAKKEAFGFGTEARNSLLASKTAKKWGFGFGTAAFLAIAILGVMHGVNSGNWNEAGGICGPGAIIGGAVVGLISFELVYKCIRSYQNDNPRRETAST